MVTELDIKKQIRRLRVVFNTSKDEAELIEGWKWVLGDKVDNTEMMAAVSEYAQSGARYFPSPGQILAAARLKRAPPEYDESNSGHDQALECLACGAKLRELSPNEQVWTVWDDDERKYKNVLPKAEKPRLGILHDYKRHREKRVDIIGGYRR